MFLERDSQAEIRVGVARVARDGAPQCPDRLLRQTDLQAGEAQVVLNCGIVGSEQRRGASGERDIVPIIPTRGRRPAAAGGA